MLGSTSTKTSITTSTHRKNAKNKARSAATLYLEDSAVPSQPLPAGAINIKRLVNANIAEPSKQRITGMYYYCYYYYIILYILYCKIYHVLYYYTIHYIY